MPPGPFIAPPGRRVLQRAQKLIGEFPFFVALRFIVVWYADVPRGKRVGESLFDSGRLKPQRAVILFEVLKASNNWGNPYRMMRGDYGRE